jgi:tetratricopeptide (TPR) repeat protein
VALELVLRARHCLALDRLDEAQTLAREAAAHRDVAPDALHVLGRAAYRQGRLDEAEAALRRAIERDGRVAAYHGDLGNVLQDRGRLKDAIACYRRALRLHPGFAEAWNDLGTARYALGELEPAADCYRRAVQLRADHAVAYANLAAVYRKLGLLAEARRALQRELWLRLKAGGRALFGKPKLDLGSAGSLARLARRELEGGNLRLAAEICSFSLRVNPNHVPSLLTLSNARLRQGRAAEALEAARAAGGGSLELARALAAAGTPDEALTAYEKAPPTATALAELAELRLARGEPKAAEGLLRRALALEPGAARLHAALGESLHRQNALADAEVAYRHALELDSQLLAIHVRLSDLLRLAGRHDEAHAAARRALEIDDQSPLAHVALGLAHKAGWRLEAAIQSLERALELDPRDARTLHQLALALREAGRLEEAIERLRAALRLAPDQQELLCDLGVLLTDTMRYDEAARCLRRALELQPDSLIATLREALLFDQLGDHARCEAALRRAAELAPDHPFARYVTGLHHLKHGDYARGWDGYEYRRHLDTFAGRHRSFALTEWDGAPLEDRTLLVLPEQGLGDEMMFASCLPEVARRARHVVLECDAKLEPILRRSFPDCTVVSRLRTLANDWVTRLEPRPELRVSAGSLARHFRRSLADFPGEAFLRADSAKTAAWRKRLDALPAGRKIGLSWRGGVGYTGKTRRSLSLEQLLPVLRLPGFAFVNLQYTDAREEISSLKARHGVSVHHWQEAIDDYDETAALVCALDGVLTVCTAIVHLSGGLGRPALVMVPFGADWRYGAVGERMPWYGSVRLVRQARPGEWGDVLAEAARRLPGIASR